MALKKLMGKIADKAGNKIAELSSLSPGQLEEIEEKRNAYLNEMTDPTSIEIQELTNRLIAASSVEIYDAYLPQLSKIYIPVDHSVEYKDSFNARQNIRYFNITKWVTDKDENNIDKLVNVYEVLSNENCNIALIFNRKQDRTNVYLGVVNLNNSDNSSTVDMFANRLREALHGNFPGTEFSSQPVSGEIPFIQSGIEYSVASVSNIPTEKSKEFRSQTIEKLLDGYVPKRSKEEYTLVLLATPVTDIQNRKLDLGDYYTGLAPYASWQTNFTYVQSDSTNSMATFGINAGVSAGLQNGQNQAITNSTANSSSSSDTEGRNANLTDTESTSLSESDSKSITEARNQFQSATGGVNGSLRIGKENWPINGTIGIDASTTGGSGTSEAVTALKQVGKTYGKAVANSVGKSISNTLGKAVTNTLSSANGISKAVNFGGNFGANFARSSNVTATVGKNEGITQNFTNFTVEHTLELLKAQMARLDQSSALGMWDFGAYVVSEQPDVANNIAHEYLALTQGEKSYLSEASINLWRKGRQGQGAQAQEICAYLKDLRQPVFGLSPEVIKEDATFNVYPSTVTATTSLTGKELAYSLNFPRKSVQGLPVLQCAEFGREIDKYDSDNQGEKIHIGQIFHMNHTENTDVDLDVNSLASHVFITGSTGSGKSNTIYQILSQARSHGVHFLVIEPAKGEYKDVFGNDADVSVYSTNPYISDLLRINPFSFPKKIHIFEHMDRLVEIFNVCWPMYAAMPAVLKSAVEKAYVDCGWDLVHSTNEYGDDLYPNFSDVARNIKEIIDSSEYDAENKGAYKGSLLTRLQSLTNGLNGMIFTENGIPDERLFDKNTIIDLSRVGSSETKSLLMGMIVLKLQEYRMAEHRMNSSLRHLTVLEEAHNLLKRTSAEQPVDGGNLQGKSVEMVSNAIAEMRTYGEGFIIADQAPGLLDMAAIRNTNTKIIMRLPDQQDRELTGHAANLNDDQIKELAKLPCGVGAVYQNEWIQPVLCKVEYFETDDSEYSYNLPAPTAEEADHRSEKLLIASMLSNAIRLDKETILKDVKPILQKLEINSSSQAAIMKLLENPVSEPQMDVLAPIMASLFPDVAQAVEQCVKVTDDYREWTSSAEEALHHEVKQDIDGRVKRDIIQAVFTYYFALQNHDPVRLEEWKMNGELR